MGASWGLDVAATRRGVRNWVFWSRPNREFDCWYINLQQPFRRTTTGYDTLDMELDIVVPADLSWRLKDDEVLEQRVREGRYTRDQVAEVRAEAKRVTDELDAGRKWWSDDWARWCPDPKMAEADVLVERGHSAWGARAAQLCPSGATLAECRHTNDSSNSHVLIRMLWG